MNLFLCVLLILFGLVLLFGIPFNIIKAKGINKKIVITGNIIFLGVLVLVLMISALYRSSITKKAGDSKIAQYSFLSSMTYTGIENGYHTFYIGVLMGGYDIAVPMGDVELPASVKEDSRVIVAYKNVNPGGRRWFGDEQTQIGSGEYYVADNVTAVFRDYSNEEFIILFADVFLLFVFNFSELMIVLGQLKKSKSGKQYASE